MRLRVLIAAWALAGAAHAEPPAVPLDEVVVTATRVPEPLADVPAATSVVPRDEIQDARPTVSIAESLPRVAGALAQDSGNFAQDVRLQVRGFGTRSAFGIREVKVLMDGLPLTLPDGQSDLDDVELGAVEHMELVRGPRAALYGNASGGVLQLFSEEPPADPAAWVRATGGSFGLAKVQLAGGGRSGSVGGFFSGSFFRTDGFRDHSAAESGIVTGKLRWQADPSTDVTFLLAGVDAPVADDPGAVTRATADADPEHARPLNVDLDAGEEVLQGRLGTVVRHRRESSELTAYAYALYRDFANRLPIAPAAGDGIVTFDRLSPGGGGSWVLDLRALGVAHRLLAGVDLQYQDDDRRRFANVGGRKGALGLHQRERVTGVGPYLRDTVALRDDLEVYAGVRFDDVRFDVDVEFPAGSPASGTRTFEAWSPAGGLAWRAAPGLTVFADAGTAFQVPTTTELVRPNGAGLNPDIEPQTAVGGELGTRFAWPGRAEVSVAEFLMDVQDELIPFESASGRTAFRNAGTSRRWGTELEWTAALPARLAWSGAVTLESAHFHDYETPEGSFDGNREPGIPAWQVYQELAWRPRGGVFVALEAFVVGDYPVNDANDAESPAHAVLDLRAGLERTVGSWTLAPFVGLQNLTDAAYDGTVRLNARGGRYFEPAAGFHVFGGVTVTERLSRIAGG